MRRMWWKKHKWKIIVPVLVVAVLAAAFLMGGTGSDPGAEMQTTAQPTTSQPPQSPPADADPENSTPEPAGAVCTISISCATILENMELCDPAKTGLVPEDGWILEPVTVEISEGESVFDVLLRVCKERRIHLEFVDTTMYDTAYIEGIANLYEFDVGALSGWRYSVNGWFPNYGSSLYQVQSGDVIEWVYTCDLGGDVGASDF